MAIGMACGTRFYSLAAFGTAVFVAVILLMDKLDLFAKRVAERILRIRLPADRDYETAFEPVFNQYLRDNRLISVETVSAGVLQEAVYSVVLKKDTEPQKFLEALRAVNDNHKVALVMGQQEVDL